MTGPLIAVVGHHLPNGRIKDWRMGALAIPDVYVDAVRRAGGVSAVISPLELTGQHLLARFDGFLLAGGGDVEPGRYGALRHRRVHGVDPVRDELEIDLAREAARMAVPTLAICRGAQVLNVACGGTLHQHVPDLPRVAIHAPPPRERTPVTHPVKVSESSLLASALGAAAAEVVSWHHQAIDRLGDGLTAVAWGEDGLVEAVEGGPGWLLGVQWHPEMSAAEDPLQQRLFDELVARATARRG